MNEALTWIQTVGFPIVAYLLMYFRFERKIDRLSSAIETMNERERVRHV